MQIILPFSDLTQTDIPAAGGKGANLGELTAVNLPVPPGFVISTAAYDAFVQTHDLQPQILAKAAELSPADPAAEGQIRDLFMNNPIPDELAAAIRQAYAELAATAVAVRSSATAEDLPEASFAGQQESFLNVQGEEALLTAVCACWAGLWTARAISYRRRQGIDPQTVSLAVIVQEMAPADVSGILFTANPRQRPSRSAADQRRLGAGRGDRRRAGHAGQHRHRKANGADRVARNGQSKQP
jgi:phosphoenolpyruvate synthase/pyruvate phosphate dikinase